MIEDGRIEELPNGYRTENGSFYPKLFYHYICNNCKTTSLEDDNSERFCPKCGATLEMYKTSVPHGLTEIEDKFKEQELQEFRALEQEAEEASEQAEQIPQNAIIFKIEKEGSEPQIVFEGKKVESDKAFYEDIEETAQLPEGFVCAINRKGIRLYFKLGAKLAEGTELIPLSKSELREINVSETANNELEKILNIKISENW